MAIVDNVTVLKMGLRKDNLLKIGEKVYRELHSFKINIVSQSLAFEVILENI
jgi:hypothetical protein